MIEPPATAGVPPLVRVNGVDSVFALIRHDGLGSSRGVGCSLGPLWRSIDHRHVSVLFLCSDGEPREAVFSMVGPYLADFGISLRLETVGGEPVVETFTPVRSGWLPSFFGLRRAPAE